MSRLARLNILASLGPASSDSAMIRKLFEAGADVFRINMSHTSHDKMRELVKTIRNVESSYGRPIGILVDLQGPKLRLGQFDGGAVQLNNGQSFTLDSDKAPGDKDRVQLPHPEILAALRPGHALLLDDGKVRLIAEQTSPEHAVTRVVVGGKMSDRKGVSLPDTDLPVSAMTPKDREDLEAAVTTGIDWIALSFVQRAEDVKEAKRMIRGRAAVMAKIEKPQAIDRLGDIIEASDALMVARGDLGVELTLDLSAIICWTDSGSTAIRVARERPKPPVVAITPKMVTGQKLSLVWGVHCVVAEDAHDQDDMVDRAGTIAFRDGFANAGQRVIIVAGVPLRIPGTTNMLRIATVAGSDKS